MSKAFLAFVCSLSFVVGWNLIPDHEVQEFKVTGFYTVFSKNPSEVRSDLSREPLDATAELVREGNVLFLQMKNIISPKKDIDELSRRHFLIKVGDQITNSSSVNHTYSDLTFTPLEVAETILGRLKNGDQIDGTFTTENYTLLDDYCKVEYRDLTDEKEEFFEILASEHSKDCKLTQPEYNKGGFFSQFFRDGNEPKTDMTYKFRKTDLRLIGYKVEVSNCSTATNEVRLLIDARSTDLNE